MIQLFIKWNDYNRCWNTTILPIDYVSLPLINNPNNNIWFPKFELLNARNGDTAFIVPNDNTETRIFNNGTIEMFLNKQIEAQCKMNLYLFPFDTQKCRLYFQLAQFVDQSFIQLQFDENSYVDPLINYQNSEWNGPLEIQYADMNYPLYISGVYPNGTSKGMNTMHKYSNWAQGFVVQITLERDSTYYQMFLIIPLCLLNIIMLFVVFMPLDQDKRVDVCITCVLGYTFILIVMSTLIPRTHTVPIIVFQIVALLLLATYNTIMVIIIIALKMKATKAKEHKKAFSELLENCKSIWKIKHPKILPAEKTASVQVRDSKTTNENANLANVANKINTNESNSDKDTKRYEEEVKCLDISRLESPQSRCENFLEVILCCFKSQNKKKLELDNELYIAFDKVEKDSPKNWLKLFGVIEIGFWVLKILFLNLCCIPCFLYYKRKSPQVAPKPIQSDTNEQENERQPWIEDCLCCCCANLENQTSQTSEQTKPETKSTEQTKSETKSTEQTNSETKSTEQTKSETKSTEQTKSETQITEQPKPKTKSSEENKQIENEPRGEFYKKCIKLLEDYHEKSWNQLANRLNVCWAVTSFLLLLGIIISAFVLWFGKIIKTDS